MVEFWTMQKYRSHRKHLLAREAEAASWNHRRQIYGGTGGGGSKINVSPWLAPTMGFPQNPLTPLQHVRPLHVWGHPPTDQPLMHMWPKHIAPRAPPLPLPPPTTAWAPTLHPPPSKPPPEHLFQQSCRQKVITNLSSITKLYYRKCSTRMTVIIFLYF